MWKTGCLFCLIQTRKTLFIFLKIKSLMFVWEINAKAALRTYTLFLINTFNYLNIILRSDMHTYRLVVLIKVFRFQTEDLTIILKKFHFFSFTGQLWSVYILLVCYQILLKLSGLIACRVMLSFLFFSDENPLRFRNTPMFVCFWFCWFFFCKI